MNDVERRLLIAAKECSIQSFAALFTEAAAEIRLHIDASEKLEARSHKRIHESEHPHCPTCECGTLDVWGKEDVAGCVKGIEFDGPHHEDGSVADGGAK